MGDSGQLSFFGDFRLRPSNVILLAIRSYLWLWLFIVLYSEMILVKDFLYNICHKNE